MRILHTSDWHLGRGLYGKKRYAEFADFLDWLAATIEQNGVTALLVAGDVFDTSTPSNRAQEMYYNFLCRLQKTACRHIVVIAGNHDSPSFLDAPKAILKALRIHVIGGACGDLRDEVLVLRDAQDAPELIVCAVPYLRDHDLRTVEAGESVESKEKKLLDGIRRHYEAVAALAETTRTELGADIPIVAMGHLFTAGGKTVEGDGVRELYVGSLAHVHASIFPPSFDYLALGHLHVPQKVGKCETIRYSGSPLAMGFGEAKQQKSVCQVDFRSRTAVVQIIDVPVFQSLECVRGDWATIERRIRELVQAGASSWLEVIYEGDEVSGGLRRHLDELLAAAPSAPDAARAQIEILRVKDLRVVESILGTIHAGESLDTLSPDDVFLRRLDSAKVPEAQRPDLLCAYREILLELEAGPSVQAEGKNQKANDTKNGNAKKAQALHGAQQ